MTFHAHFWGNRAADTGQKPTVRLKPPPAQSELSLPTEPPACPTYGTVIQLHCFYCHSANIVHRHKQNTLSYWAEVNPLQASEYTVTDAPLCDRTPVQPRGNIFSVSLSLSSHVCFSGWLLYYLGQRLQDVLMSLLLTHLRLGTFCLRIHSRLNLIWYFDTWVGTFLYCRWEEWILHLGKKLIQLFQGWHMCH